MTVGNLNINKVNLLQHLSPPTNNKTGIADTGATGNFLQPTAPHNQYTIGAPPIVVSIPNGKAMRSTQECQLQLDQLPEQARTGHLLSGLAHNSLISIGHLCDALCTTELTANTVNVKKRWGHPPIRIARSIGVVALAPDKSGQRRSTNAPRNPQYVQSSAFLS